MKTDRSPIAIGPIRWCRLDSLFDAACIIRSGRVDHANSALLKLLGASRPDQVIGRDSLNFIHPDHQALNQRRMHRLQQRGGRLRAAETTLVRLDGQSVAVHLNADADRDAHGPLVAVVLREEPSHGARRESAALLQQQAELIELSFEPILIWDWTRGILTWNRGCERLYGYRRAEALGQASHDLLRTRFPETRSAFEAALLRDGQWSGELHHQTRDGPVVRVESRMQLLVQGERRLVLEANRDLTQGLNAEAALRQQIERYDLVMAGAGDAIWDWDVPNRRVTFSPHWKTLRGYRPDETIEDEEAWSSSIHPEDAPRVLAAVQAHFEGKTEIFQEDYRILCRDGTWKWIQDRGLAQRDASGRVIRMAGSERDITEQKRGEAHLAAVLDAQGVISTANTDYPGLLRCVLETLSRLTGAEGACLERVEGAEMVYEAAIGLADGFVGLRLKTAQSLSGRALATGQLLRADDTETDPRVDRAACRRIGLRSMLLVPLHYSAGWFGVLKLMGSRVAAFDAGAEQILRLMAEFLGATIARAHAQQALHHRAEEVERLLEVVPAAVWVTKDPDCRTITGNRRANEFYEAAPGENVSASTVPEARHFFTPAGRELAPEELPMQLAAATNQEVRDVELEVQLASGRTRSIFGNAVPLRDESGGVRGAIASFMDITDRKRVEAALRDSEERLRTSFANASIGFALHGPDFRFLDANPAYCTMTGYPREELLAFRSPELMHPDDRPANMALAERMLAGEIPGFNIENRYVRKGGESIWVRKSVSIIRRVDGVPRWIITLVEDITERKQAEEKLRESEARLRLATEAAKIGAFDWNIQTGVNTWTPELEAIYGLAPGEFGRTQPAWEELVHPEDRAGAVAKVAETLATGAPVKHEWRIVWRDASEHWVAGRFQAFLDAHGKPVRMAGINIDITQRKMAEAALRESEARLSGLIQSALDAIVVVDDSQRVVLFNPAAERLFQRRAGEMLGRPIDCLIPKRSRAAHREHAQHFTLAEVTARQMGDFGEIYGLRADGQEIVLEASVSRTESQGIPLCTVILRDITARKQTVALQEANLRLRELAAALQDGGEAERKRVARELHDDLGQQLLALRMELARLGERPEQERPAELSAKLREMQKLLDTTMLSVRRIISNLRPAILDDLGLSAALEWLAEDFTEHSGIPCCAEIEEDGPGIDDRRATAVFRIVQEALSNILRHAEATQVRFALTHTEDFLRLVIEDNGKGISEQARSKTQSFGLSGMRERVSLFNGTLEITGAPEAGTRIRVILPNPDSEDGGRIPEEFSHD